jgi:hypothetical protein
LPSFFLNCIIPKDFEITNAVVESTFDGYKIVFYNANQQEYIVKNCKKKLYYEFRQILETNENFNKMLTENKQINEAFLKLQKLQDLSKPALSQKLMKRGICSKCNR